MIFTVWNGLWSDSVDTVLRPVLKSLITKLALKFNLTEICAGCFSQDWQASRVSKLGLLAKFSKLVKIGMLGFNNKYLHSSQFKVDSIDIMMILYGKSCQELARKPRYMTPSPLPPRLSADYMVTCK